MFLKDGKAETATYKSLSSSENIRLFQFSKSGDKFTVDWNLPDKEETHILIDETGSGWKIYLGGINNLNVVTVNKDKTEIHWLHTGDGGGSNTVHSCKH